MGRKKKKPVKPWCWYCNREFDDDKILVQHQRAKHFKCPFCHKKLYSGPGLTVHCIQVHKESLDKIPEALPNKNSVDIDIYGMQGIPDADLREHEQLKRGDDGSKQSDNNQKQQHQQQHQQQQQQQNHNQVPQHLTSFQQPPSMDMMRAAMFQHAMGMGVMPHGFHMPPPGMPPMMPGFMPPPPGYPGMPPGMQPGMPPLMAFQPGMLPPSTLPNQMGFPIPPPMGLLPSTSGTIPLPPPMSGVGPLIGLPPMPPHFSSHSSGAGSSRGLPPKPTSMSADRGSPSNSQEHRHSERSQSQTQRSPVFNYSNDNNSEFRDDKQSLSLSSAASTISKPAAIVMPSGGGPSVVKFHDFIAIPGAKSRIMHPDVDLSMEEMRSNLKRYRSHIDKMTRPATGAAAG